MGTTPTYAWPYPDDTDPVADGAQNIEDLALAVESTVSGLPTEKIAQVIQTTKFNTFSTTSATKAPITGFDVTITPSSATSKVLVTAFGLVSHDTAARAVDMDLERNGTPIFLSPTADTFAPTGGESATMVMNFLDSPATTSAVTYRVTMANGGAGTAYFNRYAGGVAATSSAAIIVMEVTA